MTSARERRLWLLAGLVVVGIWSTLGLAARLADDLAARGAVDAAFAAGAAAVLLAVVLHAMRRRPGPGELGVGVGVVAVYALAFVRMASPAERTHLVEYGVVALLVHAALLERGRHGAGVRRPATTAFVLATAAGVVDELLQWVLPSRVFDVRDIGFNAVAAGLAMGAAAALARVRDRSRGSGAA